MTSSYYTTDINIVSVIRILLDLAHAFLTSYDLSYYLKIFAGVIHR